MMGSDIQVDSTLYSTSSYCHPGRFAAYAYQIKEILNSGAQTVLEIGPGSGVVTYVLRQAGMHVDTLDHDPFLKPDFTASVLNLPFAPNSYDAVLCCQVLEHLPWEQFTVAMTGLATVAKKMIVLSLPHVSKHYYLNFRLPKIKTRTWSVDMPMDKKPMNFNGEHHWEIGRGITEQDISAVFKSLRLSVQKSYRAPEYRYHHFFCLIHDET